MEIQRSERPSGTGSNETGCPLCHSTDTDLFLSDRERAYLRCSICLLVFVPPNYWLRRDEERDIYDLHENTPQDQGYRQFLSRLSVPLLKKLGPKQKGLDFGCGPGPTLSILLEEQGQQMDLYDPIYHNNRSVFNKSYDFICATEVVEHLRNPFRDFEALFAMLKPGGWLGIMTKLVIDKHAFGRWHYIRDRTHICFYSRQTLEYLSRRFNTDIHFVEKDVILLHKMST